MSWREKPPFRADHVGSLLRPAELREARDGAQGGRISKAELRDIEDRAINDAVALQERVGLQSITDGEFRRVSWRDGFFDNVDGFSRQRVAADFSFRLADGKQQAAAPVPTVVARLKRRNGIATEEFKFLKAATRGMAKVTLPAPSVMHWFIGNAALASGVYRDVEEYMADIVVIYRAELDELAALGCRYVQLDEVAIPIMCDTAAQEIVRGRGEDPLRLVDLYVATINDCIRERPDGMTVCLHMCRGNVGAGMGTGGYDEVAERAFPALAVDGFLLEYDTPRAGDFAPLRLVGRETVVALGLMSTKSAALEPADELKRRVEGASRFLDADRLCLAPQCGFASGFRTDRMSIADEERKLAHLVSVAHSIW